MTDHQHLLQASDSQFELLSLPPPTPSPGERSNPYDSYSDISRSLSPARPEGRTGSYHSHFKERISLQDPPPDSPPLQSSVRELYLPLALRRITFALFLTTFVVLAGVLGFLFGLSVSRHGLNDVDSHLYYVWTYGPNAALTTIAVFWNQVEWRMMQWTSWSLMYEHARSVNESVLLDYHSEWNVWAMLLAAKRKHFRVTLVVLGSLLISALLVVSTALFVGQFTSTEYATTLQMASRINPPGNLNLTAVDSLPYIRTFLVTYQNLTAPLGTYDSSVYEMFFDKTVSANITASFMPNTTYTANVSVLTFSLDCENATVINNPRASDLTESLAMESASCRNTSTYYLFTYASQGGVFQLSATLGCCDCGPDDGTEAQGNSYGIQVDNGLDWRFFTYSSRFKQTPKSRLLLNTTNADVLGFICKPLIVARTASVDLAREPGTDNIRSNLTYGNIIDIPTLNKSSAAQLLLGAYRSYYQFTGGPASSSFFLNPGDDGNLDKFFDAQYLQDRAETSIPNIMAQVAHEFFMSDAQNEVSGHVATMSYRLVVRRLAFSLMMAGLILLGLISAALLFIGQKACFPRDPSSIAAAAAILSKSPGLKDVLHTAGALSTKELGDYLSTNDFKTQVDRQPRFSIITSGSSSIIDTSTHRLTWWRPASSLIWFRVLTLSAPIVVIILFETGVQLSGRNGGLATIPVNGAWHYFWLYWPPQVILGTRVLLNIVDFNTKVYQPFYMLSRGQMTASVSLFESLRGKIAIIAMGISLRKRYWAVMASTVAVITSPFMSIIVASLWEIVPAATTHNVSLRQLDRWNFSDPTGSLYYSPTWYSGIDSRDTGVGITLYLGQDGVIPSMILNYNFSYPQWTTKDFVLPTFGIDANASESLPEDTTNVTISALIPAIRANLNCQVHPSAKVSWWPRPQTNTSDPNGILTNVSYAISGLGNNNDNCGYLNNFTISFGLSFDKVNPLFFGESVGTRVSSLNLTTRSDCPTRLFFLSSLGSNPTTKVLTCRPRLEQVQASVTFNYPDLSFSASSPPFIDSKIQPQVMHDGFFNTSHAVPISDADVEQILNDYVSISANNSAGLGDVFPSVSEVESALLGSYEANTFDQILYTFGTSFQDMFDNPELMRTQMEQLHSIIVGQVLRSYGRQANIAPSGNDPGQAPIQATLSTPNERERLMPNPTISRILEGLLMLMLLCMIAAMALQHTRHVVPKEPGSIGAVMSLLAGAGDKFWAIFDKMDAVEWMSDREMEKSGMFDGLKFRMGWVRDGQYAHANGAEEHTAAEISTASRTGGYSKINADEVDYTDGLRRRWCIDVDEQYE